MESTPWTVFADCEKADWIDSFGGMVGGPDSLVLFTSNQLNIFLCDIFPEQIEAGLCSAPAQREWAFRIYSVEVPGAEQGRFTYQDTLLAMDSAAPPGTDAPPSSAAAGRHRLSPALAALVVAASALLAAMSV